MSIRPITAPGPIKVDHDATALRAKVVRDALREAAGVEGNPDIAVRAMAQVAGWASDEALAKLGRLLK